jgi:hypothetical protein
MKVCQDLGLDIGPGAYQAYHPRCRTAYISSRAAVVNKTTVMKTCHRVSMNATPPVLSTHVHLSARTDEACIWRGRYIEEFAMAEVAVSEALATLSTIASRSAKSLRPTAVGQRFEALRIVVGASGPLAPVGGRVARALDDVREHQSRRNFLCHGSSEVWTDHLGDWCMALCLTSFRAGAIERNAMQITAAEAAVLLQELRSARLRLEGQLRGMLASLTR